MRINGTVFGLKYFGAACAAALALLAVAGFAAPAVAGKAPAIYVLAPPGGLTSVGVEGFDLEGTNPGITEATLSTTQYYSKHEVSERPASRVGQERGRAERHDAAAGHPLHGHRHGDGGQ